MKARELISLALLLPEVLLAQLRIVSPNGGEVLVPGNNYTIQWAGTAPTAKVTIDFSTDGGTVWNPVASSVSGLSYIWTVPATISNTCLLRISLPQQILSDSILADGIGRSAYPSQFTWSPTSATIGMGDRNEILDTADLHTIFRDSVSNDPCITFSPDGQTILLRRPWGADMISIPQQKVLRRFDFGLPFCVMWLNSDRHFIGVGSQTIRFDTASPVGIDTLKTSRWTYSMYDSWNATDTRIAVAYASNLSDAFMFDLQTGDSLYSMDAGENCHGVLMSPDGIHVVTAGQTNIFKTWDVATGAPVATFSMPSYQDYTYQWSPDNRHIAVAGANDSVVIWDALTGSVSQVLRITGDHAFDIGYHPGDGKWLAVEANSGYLYLFDPATGTLLQQLDIRRPTIGAPGNWGTGTQMLWSPDGNKIAIRDGYGRYGILHVEERPAAQDQSDGLWAINNITAQTFAVRIATDSAFEGEQIDLPIILEDPLGVLAQGAKAVRIKLTYNSTLLEHLGIADPNIVLSKSVGRAELAVTLNNSPDTIIGKLHFRAGLGNAVSTPIKIDSASTDSPNALLTHTDGLFSLRGICYAGGTRLMNPSGKPNIIVERPTGSLLSVDMTTIEEGRTILSLVDIIGRSTKTLLDGSFDPGTRRLSFDLTGVADGNYLLIMQTPTKRLTTMVEVAR